MPNRSLAARDEELVASYPADPTSVEDVSAYRTTWLISSLACLRSGGHLARYRAALREVDRRVPGAEAAIDSLVANNWLPLIHVRAHYDACDRLGISDAEVLEAMRSADGGQVRRTWHAQIIAAAQRPNASPWALLSQVPKWWPRAAVGGSAALYRQGPTAARLEYGRCSLFESPYYTASTRNVILIFASHFCSDLSVVALPRQRDSASFVLRWR